VKVDFPEKGQQPLVPDVQFEIAALCRQFFLELDNRENDAGIDAGAVGDVQINQARAAPRQFCRDTEKLVDILLGGKIAGRVYAYRPVASNSIVQCYDRPPNPRVRTPPVSRQ
jgi:hypothetical protein